MRVVSLLPSATEIVGAIGALDLLVGRSHECDWPPGVEALPALTGQRTRPDASAREIDAQVRAALASDGSLYTLDAARLADLRPDVVLTQDLCEVCSIDLRTVRGVVRTLDPVPAVISLDPHAVGDVFADMVRVGDAIGRGPDARRTVRRLAAAMDTADHFVRCDRAPVRVAVLEWLDPLFVGGHWTPELVQRAGAVHPLNGKGRKSRVLAAEELAASAPDALVVAPCGLPLARTRAEWAAFAAQPWVAGLPAVRGGRVALVDGSQMFNRPGPRLVEAFLFLVGWLHGVPDMIPAGFPWQAADPPTPGPPPALTSSRA